MPPKAAPGKKTTDKVKAKVIEVKILSILSTLNNF